MSNYSDNPAMVRVDFWHKSGKWYETKAIKWTAKLSDNLYDGFMRSLQNHFKDRPVRMTDMDATCLKPYHEPCYPIQIKNGGWNDDL